MKKILFPLILILISGICFAQEEYQTEDQILLYVIIFGYDSHPHEYKVKMPDFKTCFKAVENHDSKVPNGDEAEAGVIIFCGTSDHKRCFQSSGSSYYCKRH